MQLKAFINKIIIMYLHISTDCKLYLLCLKILRQCTCSEKFPDFKNVYADEWEQNQITGNF